MCSQAKKPTILELSVMSSWVTVVKTESNRALRSSSSVALFTIRATVCTSCSLT
ncbi:hypothetical protein GBAR_LOCUS12477 [Geodia barretti]|uniref:Uncharacterized protein n=1 Tax=Geodia barretti TaxID=519541 RepID=A0AA35WNI9_GEOBA|nr:hypothetical protein GBAR_LOCUS12477 [Geodia barretti]